MPVILVIDRTGSVKELSSKTYEEDNLYKKAGFKTPNDFHMHHVFEVNMNEVDYRIRLYGKIKGKAGQENKYEFPPPIDNVIFFGSCCIVLKKKTTNIYMNLTLDIWEKIYELLFGGFEDLDATKHGDKSDIDVLKFVSDDKLTVDGYLKDGFVVDSDEDNTEYEYNDDDIDALCIDTDNAPLEETEEMFELQDIGSELSEESYLEDDEE